MKLLAIPEPIHVEFSLGIRHEFVNFPGQILYTQRVALISKSKIPEGDRGLSCFATCKYASLKKLIFSNSEQILRPSTTRITRIFRFCDVSRHNAHSVRDPSNPGEAATGDLFSSQHAGHFVRGLQDRSPGHVQDHALGRRRLWRTVR